TCGLRQY
nr:Chain C, TISSUE PLASMINOGEN ACTIVATOR [Homo sapiens]1A5H_D Chain D, TISSUE PLASMINOGEN ACTIVATOR [Homo sapiens]